MHHALGVGVAEGSRDLGHQTDRRLGRQAPVLEELAEGVPLDALEDQKGTAVGEPAQGLQPDDPFVTQLGRGLRLPREALDVRGGVQLEDLGGEHAGATGEPHLEDLTRSPLGDLPNDFEGSG
jgi:hypothetical protein